LSLSFNGGTVGPNAMDQAGTFPVSSNLTVYAIYNPTTNTWAALGTVSGHGTVYSGSFMPTGYVASVKLWSGMTDADSNLVQFYQINRKVKIPAIQTIELTGSVGTPTSLSLSTIIPPDAGFVSGWENGAAYNNQDSFIYLGSDAATALLGQIAGGISQTAAIFTGHNSTLPDLMVTVPQTVYYTATVNAYLYYYVSGYELRT
jgi:hypothetical protein